MTALMINDEQKSSCFLLSLERDKKREMNHLRNNSTLVNSSIDQQQQQQQDDVSSIITNCESILGLEYDDPPPSYTNAKYFPKLDQIEMNQSNNVYESIDETLNITLRDQQQQQQNHKKFSGLKAKQRNKHQLLGNNEHEINLINNLSSNNNKNNDTLYSNSSHNFNSNSNYQKLQNQRKQSIQSPINNNLNELDL
jgi:hypothetical protein